MIVKKIKRSEAAEDPSIVWNSFVDLLAMEQYEDLTDIQRIAYLCFWYDSEVQNGGHLQYFENQGTGLYPETISALRSIGAVGQVKILESAVQAYFSSEMEIETAEEFVESAEEFAEFDEAYYDEPSIAELLEQYLRDNQDSFVQIVDDCE